MPNYQNGKIYEIICNINGERYIGSTIKTLSKRLERHRYIKNDCKSKQIIERGDYDINLLQSYPCNNRDELRIKEREWYDKLENINGDRPFVSMEDKKKERKEYMTVYNKKYYENNKEYLNNSDTFKKNQKKYRIKNIEKIHKKAREKITCVCGSNICRDSKSKHEQTIKHITFLQNNSSVEPSTQFVIAATNP
jgi:hypothetical protein